MNTGPRIVSGMGPQNAKIALVGEAPGKQEAFVGIPFIGASGQELNRILKNVGIERKQCYVTNVFKTRPPRNDLIPWCVQKKVALDEYALVLEDLKTKWPDFNWPTHYNWPPLKGTGKYLHPKGLDCLPRLQRELNHLSNLNLVVALGGTAVWALLNMVGIEKARGSIFAGALTEHKVLPTYHPAHILRFWKNKPILMADLMKAKTQQEFPDIRRPIRHIWIRPTLEDLPIFWNKYLKNADCISYDIETAGELITCIGFAGSPDEAIVIPFVDFLKPKYHYWRTLAQEVEAWKFAHKVLTSPRAKVAQHGMYDVQYLWEQAGRTLKGDLHDTMLMHHALQLEMKKDLGFLGSLYTDEAAWKLMVQHRTDREEKDD